MEETLKFKAGSLLSIGEMGPPKFGDVTSRFVPHVEDLTNAIGTGASNSLFVSFIAKLAN